MDQEFINENRVYWRFVPGGEGKIDTSRLLHAPDAALIDTWRRNKEARYRGEWEARHFIEHFADRFAGKRILSFGSGLAYSEIDFLDRGAHVTFADIVDTNIKCIERLYRLLGHSQTSFVVMDDSSRHEFGGPYDHVFAYGSLMYMPEEDQARTLANFRRALAPGGSVFLMLYTPEFVRWTGTGFDHRAFARAADESVGDLHAPWADWHDDEKIGRLAPDFSIAHAQTYNQGRFVWYEIVPKPANGPARPFLDLIAAEERGRVIRRDVSLAAFSAADADVRLNDGLHVVTSSNQYHYAVTFPPFEPPTGDLVLAADIEIEAGGASVGLLDVAEQRFVMSKLCTKSGMHYAALPPLPGQVQLIVSNFQPQGAGVSRFTINALRLLSDSAPAP